MRGQMKTKDIGYGFGMLASKAPAWWPRFRSAYGFRGLVGCPATHRIG